MKKLLLFIIILTTFISCEEDFEPICGKVIEVETVSDSERNIYIGNIHLKRNIVIKNIQHGEM